VYEEAQNSLAFCMSTCLRCNGCLNDQKLGGEPHVFHWANRIANLQHNGNGLMSIALFSGLLDNGLRSLIFRIWALKGHFS
jgi:hypothetical protein